MVHAIRIHATGGPEKLIWEPVEVPAPGPDQVLLRQTAVGLNFIDTYHRSGLYPVAQLPSSIGLEACGVVEALGPHVSGLKVGDRVAYAGPPIGAYAEARVMPAEKLIRIPDSIDDATAAGMMLQGMTAEYLLRRTYPVKPGDTILVHAAAGGVGLIMCQWASHIGATVIGTVGSAEKAALAKANGCTHTIFYREEDFVERVLDITGGQGVPVIYDGIGKDTLEHGFDCLRTLGMMVSFGQASGPVGAIQTAWLAKGSFFLTRPSLMAYTARRVDLEDSAAALIDMVQKGAVRIDVRQTYPLREAAQAHRDLEARRTSGTTVLTID